MSIDLSAQDKAIKQITLDMEKKTIDTTRKLALTIDTALVLATPVDTGRARGNWLPSVNAPILKSNEEARDPSGQNAISAMQGILPSVKFGDDIYITNNLAYIGRLNDGHSKQAPTGFVEKAVATGERAVLK